VRGMPVVFGREVDGQFLGIAVSWHYGSAIGAVLAWVGLTLGIAQRLLEGLSEGQRLLRAQLDCKPTIARLATPARRSKVLAGMQPCCCMHYGVYVVAAIVRTNGGFAASFTALDFSSTMRECAGGLAVSVRTKEMGRTYCTVADAALQTGEAYARMRNCYCFNMRREWPGCNSLWVLRGARSQQRGVSQP
jgi:hypothetical protein